MELHMKLFRHGHIATKHPQNKVMFGKSKRKGRRPKRRV